ncbi:MAG: class I SAM-dependent methyltransferase [Acidobacteriota bacterium]
MRRWLRAANRIPLDRWVLREGQKLTGLILNVGSGEDSREYGSRTVRIDAFAPACTIRADLGRCLPFSDGVFDGAVCTEVLEHVPDPKLLLAEIARVLKPSAPVVISIPFAFHYHPDPRDLLRLTPPGLRAELERAGFEVDLTAGIGNKFTTFALLVESIHPLLKAVIRVVVLLVTPLFLTRPPRDGRWSDWASNAIAIARKRG